MRLSLVQLGFNWLREARSRSHGYLQKVRRMLDFNEEGPEPPRVAFFLEGGKKVQVVGSFRALVSCTIPK
jgi:hypothetical protein